MQFCRSPIDKGGHMKPYIGYACSIVSLVFVLTSCSGGGGGGGSGGGSTDTTPGYNYRVHYAHLSYCPCDRY